MSETKSMTINRLPAPTWRWLKMNAAEATVADYAGSALVGADIPQDIDAARVACPHWSTAALAQEQTSRLIAERSGALEPETVREKDLASAPDAIYTGAGSEADALVDAAAGEATIYTAREGRAEGEPLRLHFFYDQKEGEIDAIRLVGEANSRMTVIMDYAALPETSCRGLVQTKFSLAEGALLRLVQIHRLGKEAVHINDVGGYLAAGARAEIIHLVLSGSGIYEGCRVDLAGDGSSLAIDTAYLGTGEDSLDFNYFANHLGKKTECAINADGVLRDRAKKIFRGTIDFKAGASGAVGNEKEDVLLMDDTAVNKTIPLILCAEEDVVGNHGATIGRLDEQLLFYLESRGMDRAEVYEMMARARLDAVIRKIPDEETRRGLNC